MIQYIRNIGEYAKTKDQEDILDFMVNHISSDSIKTVIDINVTNKKLMVTTKAFYKDVVNDALFYQAGKAFKGGGFRLDFYDIKIVDDTKQLMKKIKAACKFCEIEGIIDEIYKLLIDYIIINGNESYVLLRIDGKTPKELFKEKFIKEMYFETYNECKDKGNCHICGDYDKMYNTVGYKFYTNDKCIYGNVNSIENAGFTICKNCLDDIIIAKKYIDENLTTYWLDSNVMFLPHDYNTEVAQIYESTKLNAKKEKTKFLKDIRNNEEDIFCEIEKSDKMIDIIFFYDAGKYYYIYHTIQSIMPSRFGDISRYLENHDELKLWQVVYICAAVSVKIDKVESTDKEKMRSVESILSGRKINRGLFFNRAISVLKYQYLKDNNYKYIRIINRVYNFLCDCNCLEKRWDEMRNYKNYDELFEDNKEYFDKNEKKAWFVLGKAYSLMIYYIKNKKTNDSNDRTSLEKNFFFSRRFDFDDFIYFSNLLNDKTLKYKETNSLVSRLLTEAKLYMSKKEGKLSQDEAKYLFFWGYDMYFESKNNENIEKNDEEE